MPYCYPPDPNTRKPNFTPPPMSCDTHFHVFGPPETFPFVSTHEYTPPAAPLEHYLKMTEVIGIQRGVVVPAQRARARQRSNTGCHRQVRRPLPRRRAHRRQYTEE